MLTPGRFYRFKDHSDDREFFIIERMEQTCWSGAVQAQVRIGIYGSQSSLMNRKEVGMGGKGVWWPEPFLERYLEEIKEDG